jgi:hypothetical protein
VEISSVDKCAVNAVSSLGEGQSSLLIYPNPAHDVINISLNTKGNVTAVVADLLGRTLIAKANQTIIDVSALKQGIYIVKVEIGDVVFVRKFLKE